MASTALLTALVTMVTVAWAATSCSGPCTCDLGDGNMIDLQPLAADKIMTADPSGKYNFVYSPCNTTCNIDKEHWGNIHCLGENVTMKHGEGGNILDYTTTGVNTIINLVCNESATTPLLTLQTATSSLYYFNLTSSAACPKAIQPKTTPATPKTSPTKPTPAKTSPTKPTPAKTSPTKPTPAKTSPTKPTPAKTSPTKPTPAKTSPTKPTPAKTSPTKPTPAKTSPTKPTPAKTSPTKPTPAKTSPTKPTPAKTSPTKPTPAKTSPTKPTPAKTSPTKPTPAKTSPKTKPTPGKTSRKPTPGKKTSPKPSNKPTTAYHNHTTPAHTTPGGGANSIVSFSASVLVLVALVVRRLV